MRTLVDIPEEDIRKLDALAAREETSRAAKIREAVKLYLAGKGDDRSWIDRGFGLWEHRDDIPDSVEYQRAIREDRTPYEGI
jgi:hypothetical protein